MLSKYRLTQSSLKFASHLIATRGQKASTTKLPITLLEVSKCKIAAERLVTIVTAETIATAAEPYAIMQDVDNLGLQGQQVVVSHGYARNCLYPRQLAAPVPTKPRDRHHKVSQVDEPVCNMLAGKFDRTLMFICAMHKYPLCLRL